MNKLQRILKRGFDICLSLLGLAAFGWLILICWVISTLDTKQNGLFLQERIGRQGKIFKIIKIRTMRPIKGVTSVVTTRQDPRITHIGAILRKFKLDELPQLINIFVGQMSFVGPRPDVAGFADLLQGEDRIILTIRPGITGPASLAFRNEEELLADCDEPEIYNREVIFPAKVKMNYQYIKEYSFSKDIKYIADTLTTVL
ncbi:MAG: sugar transferase [Desulfobacteraceae bacterium]|jgi:lipopolysaccharide/colanic/teichoic acid biosynthesis glycosyltransferase